jgi:hypothetical protein
MPLFLDNLVFYYLFLLLLILILNGMIILYKCKIGKNAEKTVFLKSENKIKKERLKK